MSVIRAHALGTVRPQRRSGAIAALLLAVGCSAPAPLAELHVSGSGQFDCLERRNYGGCRATFAVKHSPLEPDETWEPLLTDATFPLDVPSNDFRVIGAPSGVPVVLEPGHYALLARVIGIADVLNQDGSYIQTGPFAVCTQTLAVTPATRAVRVQVFFEKGGELGAACSMDVKADDSARLEIS